MTRFIAGVLVCLLVQALGWPTLERALRATNDTVQDAYTAAEKAFEASK